MKITKAQSEQNRAHVVETAARLFRERGYDGVSVADLMAEAGLTHGGFYKHFASKADLMAEATAHALQAKMSEFQGLGLESFVQSYLSSDHRQARGDGCVLAALCGDAPRQPAAVQDAFAAGLGSMLTAVEDGAAALGQDGTAARAGAIALMSQLIGLLVMSRACPDDSPLASEILDVGRQQLLAPPARPANEAS